VLCLGRQSRLTSRIYAGTNLLGLPGAGDETLDAVVGRAGCQILQKADLAARAPWGAGAAL